jgi:hypothetical protein
VVAHVDRVLGLVGWFDFFASVRCRRRLYSTPWCLDCLGVVYGPLTTLRLTDWAHQERLAVTVGTALGKATGADMAVSGGSIRAGAKKREMRLRWLDIHQLTRLAHSKQAPLHPQTLPLADGDGRGRFGTTLFVRVVSTHSLFVSNR